MSEPIVALLKKKIDDLAAYGELDAETRRNALKEEIQFYVLNFVYHHPEYSTWIMYGGSALRIIHGLDRMSVDLDFEVPHAVTGKFLNGLKKEMENHFLKAYGAEYGFFSIKTVTGRGLLLKFNIGDELQFGHHSKQIHVKIDLNHFDAPKKITDHRPINHDQLSFVIVTYNMATLMASKIAAIFLRPIRGVGKATYEEKGRDIYDLLWYMNKKVVPDLGYLAAKNIDVKHLGALFDKLTLKMSKVNDKNLTQDLFPLFVNRMYIENWLKNWREDYRRFLDDYQIRTITALERIVIHKDFNTDNYSFVYWYHTEDGGSVSIIYTISDDWIFSGVENLPIEIDKTLKEKIEFSESSRRPKQKLQDKLKQYISLFYKKTEKYFKKTGKIALGNSVMTKIIRMTTDNLNQKEQIVLNKSSLLSCELDDLQK